MNLKLPSHQSDGTVTILPYLPFGVGNGNLFIPHVVSGM